MTTDPTRQSDEGEGPHGDEGLRPGAAGGWVAVADVAVVDERARVETHRRSRAGGCAKCNIALDGTPKLDQIGVPRFRCERENCGCGAVSGHAARNEVGEYRERDGEGWAAHVAEMREDFRGRAGAQRRHRSLELRCRRAGAERSTRRTEIDGESPDGRDNSSARRTLGRAFQRTLNNWLDWEPDVASRLAHGNDSRPCIRIEPLESRILSGNLRHQQQRGENHDPLPPTVTTELGVPNSSSFAAGALGSARHSTPFTRNA